MPGPRTSSDVVRTARTVVHQFTAFGFPGTLTTYTGKSHLVIPFGIYVVSLWASVDTAPTGADIILDLNLNGTSMFPTSTKCTITAGATISNRAVPDTKRVSSGSRLRIDIDQVGSTVAGADLTLTMEWYMSETDQYQQQGETEEVSESVIRILNF